MRSTIFCKLYKIYIMRTYFFSLLFLCMQNVFAQAPLAVETDSMSVENLFLQQMSHFPQEKLYLQTDRGIYMSGETLWFRAHLVDALMLKQANASRYVYVELVNPLGNLVERVKIRPDSLGCFYGHIPLGEDLPEGNYSLRAYTWFMQNIGEEYFPHKLIYISDPVSEAISPKSVILLKTTTFMRKYIFSVNRTTDPSLPHKPFFSPMETGTKKEKSYHWKGKISITLSRRRRFLLRARFCYRQCMTAKFPIAISESPN